MSITYEYDAARALLRTRCRGDVKLDEVIEHFRAIEADESVPERVAVLLDLTEMESLPDSTQLREVAQEFGRVETRFGWRAFAMVASSDALYGMLRVFHVHAQDYVEHSAVFRACDDAERWLDETRVLGE